jgi:hypothetical protein
MKILKAKNGNWCVKEGRAFKVEEFEPNLRKTAKHFIETINFDEFLRRLKKSLGIKPTARAKKMIKVKAIKFGGCWNIRTLNDRLLMIHDYEYNEEERIKRR